MHPSYEAPRAPGLRQRRRKEGGGESEAAARERYTSRTDLSAAERQRVREDARAEVSHASGRHEGAESFCRKLPR